MIRAAFVILLMCAVTQAVPLPIYKRTVLPPKDTLRAESKRILQFSTDLKAQQLPSVTTQYYYGTPEIQVKPAIVETQVGIPQTYPTITAQVGIPQTYPTISGQFVLPQAQPGYQYVLGPDGKYYYVAIGTQTVPVQEEKTGGLLSFLGKPLDALGNIVAKTSDVASGVINLPFSAARQVVSGVGLEDTGIGKLATGILDTGEAIEQTKLKLLTGAVELPLRVAADVAYAVKD